MKISTPRNWYLNSMSAMFHGNWVSSYETVARKFRSSVAFEWQYFLQIATISTTNAQRWCVAWISVAGIKSAAIGRNFDIPWRTVRGVLLRSNLWSSQFVTVSQFNLWLKVSQFVTGVAICDGKCRNLWRQDMQFNGIYSINFDEYVVLSSYIY